MQIQICQECNEKFEIFPIINGKKIDCRHRKLCFKCSPYKTFIEKKRKLYNCLNCKKVTYNRKFCSSSCAATINNFKSPKRKPEGFCKTCNKSIATHKWFCSKECEESCSISIICKDCKKSLSLNKDNFYIGPSFNREQCKKCQKNEQIKKRYKFKIDIISKKGSQCKICEYKKSVKVLSFNHLDPSKKEFSISNISKENIKHIESELEKCILVCRN